MLRRLRHNTLHQRIRPLLSGKVSRSLVVICFLLLSFAHPANATKVYASSTLIDPPTTTGIDDVSVLEDATPTVIDLFPSFEDPEDPDTDLTFTIVGNTNATLVSTSTVGDDGLLTLTYSANNFGSSTITVRATDTEGLSVDAPFTVNVTSVNDAPSFNTGFDPSVDENSGAQSFVNWASNISAGPNESGQTLEFVATATNSFLFSSQPTVSSVGTLTFTPASNVSGVSTVTIFLTDNGGTANGGSNTSSSQTFTITINGTNDPPTTTGISAVNVLEDGSNTVINLFAAFDDAEDRDEDLVYAVTGNTAPSLFTATSINQTTGLLTLDYAPDANGSATLTIQATDTGGLPVSTSFVVTITAVNDQPFFTKGTDLVVNDNAPFQSIPGWATNISAGAANESGQAISFGVTPSNTALFSVQPAISSDGTLTFQPQPNTSGIATLTVLLFDDGGTANGGENTSAPQTFTITISNANSPPTTSGIANVNALEDSSPVIRSLFAAFNDAEDGASGLTYTVESISNTALFAPGNPSIDPIAGTLTLAFTADAFGSSTVTIKATDSGGLSVMNDFLVTLSSVNDAPSFTPGTNVTIQEDAPPQSIPNWATNLSSGPANETSQTLSFAVTTNNNGLFSVLPTLSSAGLLSFTPMPNAEGAAIVTATIMDSGGVENGGVNTSTPFNFTITITPVNDPPTVQPETYLLEEGDLLAAIAGGTPPGVLDNDMDPDGNVLTAILVTEPRFAQNWTFNSNGSFVYLHDDSENLEDTFTYQVSDGVVSSPVVTATIQIIPANDPPIAGDIDDVRVNEDAPDFAIPLFDAFEDPDDADNTLLYTITSVSNPGLFDNLGNSSINSQTGVLTLDFLNNQNGTSTVTVNAADPLGESAAITFDVDIISVNDAPTMSIQGSIDLDEDPGPQTITDWATNIIAGPDNESNQTVSASISNNNPALFSAQPTFTVNGTSGTLAFTPMPQIGGIAEVTIVLSDDGGLASGGINTNTYEFAITIRGDNDRPTSIPFTPVEVNEDGSIASYNLFDIFDDVEDPDSTLTYSIESSIIDSIFQEVQITGTNPAILNIALEDDAYGNATISVRATDTEGLWAQEDLIIDILPVNDPPSFTGGPDVSLPQNSAPQVINEWATNIEIGPENEQNQAAAFVVLSNNNEALFNTQPAISSDGTLTFEPSLNLTAHGDAQIVFALVDNGGTENGGIDQSTTDTLNISLIRFNTTPTVNNDNYIVDQGQSIEIAVGLGVLANDTDSDGDRLRARLITPPVNGTLVLNSDGSFTYQHNNSRTTNDVFTYVANDSFEDSEVASVTISIQPLNTLFLQEVSVLEDSDSSRVDIRQQLFLNEELDYTFELLSVSDPTLFTKASVDTLTGIITLVYAPNQNGFASLNINAIPEGGNTINATQNITVLPVNDPPIAVEDIFATRENTPFEINVLNNDVDFDNDALTIRSFSPPTQGTVTVLSNGSFLYSPPSNFTGDNVSFSYVVQDDSLATDEGLVNITVFSGQFGVADLAIQQSTLSAAYNVSNVGEVVGVTRSTDGVIRAFSSEQDLFTETPSEASAANDFGQVVGAASTRDPDTPDILSISASRWDTLGLTILGSFDGRSSKAFSINNEGRIVGTSTWNDEDLFRGFLWEEGTLKELETVEGNESQAFSINQRGQIAGYEGSDATLWNGERLLRRLSGALGRAYDVNENSQAVGSIDDGTIKAAYWDESGTLTELHVEGSAFSEAYGINNSRWVVGAYQIPSASKIETTQPRPLRRADIFSLTTPHVLPQSKAQHRDGSEATHSTLSANTNLRAFLWQGGTLVDLNDIIDPNSGWVLLEARGINNAAQISGIGLFNGEQKAFVLSPTNNKAPTASNDIVFLDIIGRASIDLTSNDSDADGDSIRITHVTQGQHGTVSITDASTVTYIPDESFSGSDSFTYTIEDSQGATAQADVSVEISNNAIPERNYLSQNYPNPFNPTTAIQFGLAENSNVRLEVFNLIGQRIHTVLDGERSAGNHEIIFDATGMTGGVYIYRLQTDTYSETKKFILLK